MAESKVVKLNVGGVSCLGFVVHLLRLCGWVIFFVTYMPQETFATSPTTLVSCGETFFSSLLSGRHESEKDENGAYFIDRMCA